MRSIRLILCLTWLCFSLAGFGRAAEDNTHATLDAVKASMSEIDDALKGDNLSDGQLAQLRTRAEPLVLQLQSVITELTPRLEASRKRLAELKPKSSEAAREPDPAADDLKAEQTKFDQLDADLRTARADILQVDDYVARISAQRREIFTRETFARTSSLLSPVLWLSVFRELPADASSFQRLVVSSFGLLAARASWQQIGGFLAVIVILLALAPPLRWIARRVVSPGPQEKAPSRLRKALVAVWTLAVLSALPLVALGIVAYSLDAFDISDPRLQGVANAILGGLRRSAVAYAFARALFAPKREVWRILPISDEAAVRLSRLLLSVAIVWSVARLIEAVAESVLSYNLLVVTRALSALVISALVADTFRRLARTAEAQAAIRDTGRPVRMVVWVYLIAIFACALAGYIALATYLIEHALQFVGVVGALFLGDALLQEACEGLLSPESSFAQSLMALLGLRRTGLEQVVVVIQGVARLAVIAVALLVVIGPFGLPSQDILATARSVYFGVSFGGVTL